MKKIFLINALMLIALIGNAQIESLIDVYDASKMQIRGNVKSITEKHFDSNKKGVENKIIKVNEYFFDLENLLYYKRITNNILRGLLASNVDVENIKYIRYKNSQGLMMIKSSKVKLYLQEKKEPKEVSETTQATYLFEKVGTKVNLKDSIWGDVLKSYVYQDDRIVTQIIYKGDSIEIEKKYIYNEKKLIESIETIYKQKIKNTISKDILKIEYNDYGFISKCVELDDTNKQTYVETYDYTYDSMNNWITCLIKSKEKGFDADYEKIVRSYTYR